MKTTQTPTVSEGITLKINGRSMTDDAIFKKVAK